MVNPYGNYDFLDYFIFIAYLQIPTLETSEPRAMNSGSRLKIWLPNTACFHFLISQNTATIYILADLVLLLLVLKSFYYYPHKLQSVF